MSVRIEEIAQSPTSTQMNSEANQMNELVEQMGQVVKLLQEQKVCNLREFYPPPF